MVENVAQHFRPSEAAFIDIAQGLIRQALDEYRPVLTNFLNPRQRYIIETLVNQHDDLKSQAFGGNELVESMRLVIAPTYYEVSPQDFDLVALALNYPTKFATLSHRMILGSLISSGIARESIGDIIGDEDGRWQLVTTQPIGRFIQQTLDHIGKTKVRFEAIDLAALITPQTDWVEINTTVSSLRLDTLVANGYNISRTHAKEMIERGQVRVNWTDINKPDYVLAINDLISVRHYGRMKLIAENGITKKDKWRVTLTVTKN